MAATPNASNSPMPKSENKSQRQRVHFLGEVSDENARNQTFHRRPDHDAQQLRPHGRREPGSQPIENPQNSAHHQPQHDFVHMLLLSRQLPATVLFNAAAEIL